MNRRCTRQKQIILRVISGDGVHMTADEVYAAVRKEDPEIGLATVYRNLNLMCEEGRIQKVSDNGVSFYDGNPAPHDHFVCRICGTIMDAPTTYDRALDAAVEEAGGVIVDRHSIIFSGICSECMEKQKEKEKEKWS
ncbi:MAG: transcriptional repressor [Erysipelotrichia bacterium]|nr:transcriptional repressor [Erysipelotrichia bacterium]